MWKPVDPGAASGEMPSPPGSLQPPSSPKCVTDGEGGRSVCLARQSDAVFKPWGISSSSQQSMVRKETGARKQA